MNLTGGSWPDNIWNAAQIEGQPLNWYGMRLEDERERLPDRENPLGRQAPGGASKMPSR